MIITGMAHFESVAQKKLVEWYHKNRPEVQIDRSNVFVVWSCKTLQNYKCLASTTISGDGIYAEYTYNGDKQELYEDVYGKLTNTCHTEEQEVDMKKLFISQPMRGKSDEEILKEREKAIKSAEKQMDEPVEVIDSFFQSAPTDARPLWYLGESLKLLATADVAYFAKGWEKARGCKIEHTCAVEYGIPTIEDCRKEQTTQDMKNF